MDPNTKVSKENVKPTSSIKAGTDLLLQIVLNFYGMRNIADSPWTSPSNAPRIMLSVP